MAQLGQSARLGAVRSQVRILSPRLIYCGGEPKFGLARDFGGRLRFRSVLFGTSGDCRSIFLF